MTLFRVFKRVAATLQPERAVLTHLYNVNIRKPSLRLIQALDSMATPFDFTIVDATQPVDAILDELQYSLAKAGVAE